MRAFHSFYKLAVFGLICFVLCVGSFSPAKAASSDEKEPDLRSFFPGLLFTPSEKPPLDGMKDENPFPSNQYNETILDEDLLYQYYDAGEYGRAVFGILRLARNDNPRAMETVGLMYRLGQGLPKDHEQAARWLARAGEKHRPLAQHHLGVMHYLGQGMRMNMLQASMWLNLAAMNYPEGPNRQRALEDLRNVNLRLSRLEQTRSKGLVENFLSLHPHPDREPDQNGAEAEDSPLEPSESETSTEQIPDTIPQQTTEE